MSPSLSPDCTTSSADLATAAAVLRNITAFAYSCETAQIGTLSPEPQWLSDVSAALTKSQSAAGAWYVAMPPWVSQATDSYIHYAERFAAVVQDLTPLPTDTQELIGFLSALRSSLSKHADFFTELQQKMMAEYTALSAAHAAFRAALKEAETAYVSAATAIATITEQIAALQERVTEFTQAVTAADLSAGQTVVSTAVKVVIPIFEGAAFSFPFVAIGMSVFSVGKEIYTIIADDQKIQVALAQIQKLMNEEDKDVQELAASHSVSIVLDALEDSYDQATQHLPHLSEMWSNEADKVGIIIDAVNAGADPAKLPELTNIAAAQATWNFLSTIAQGIAAGVQPGQSIELNPATP